MADHPKDPQHRTERSVSLHEGTQSRQAPWLLTPTQAAHIENLEIDDLGVRTRRRGARAFGGSPVAAEPPGGLSAYNDLSYDEFLIGLWGSNAYTSTGNGGWTQVACDTSQVSGLLHQIVRGRSSGELAAAWCTCEEPTDASDGLNGRSYLTVYQVDTDTEAAVSLAPRCITPFQSRLFYGEGETIGWSEIGTYSAFSDTNNILIEPGIGGEITAILPSRDLDPRLIIWKQESIHVFSPRWGTDGAFIPDAADALDTINSSVRLLSQGTGCVATKSVAAVPDAEGSDVFFLASDGVRTLQRADNDVQTGAGFPISHNVPGFIDRINFEAAHKATAAVFDNAYHLAVPLDGATDNTHILRYDITNRAWSIHTWQGKDIGTFRLGGDARLWMQNLFATADSSTTGPVDPGIYQMYSLYQGDHDPSTDATNVVRPIAREESRGFMFEEPLRKKAFDRFTMQVSSAETCLMEIAFRRDLGDWITATETIIPGSGGASVIGIHILPWASSDEEIRRRTVTMSDLVRPGYVVQTRIGGVTGASEPGRLSVYFTEMQAEVLSNSYENDA